jgi:hypothetical protein
MADVRHDRPSGRGSLEKVVFSLEPDSWHGHGTETMWAELVSPGQYRLRNVPFYARGVSVEDVVHARFEDDGLVFSSVAARSGHSTYRLFVKGGIESAEFRLWWRRLETLGCSFEQSDRLLAVDVAPQADIHEVYHVLEQGMHAEVWDFEEGHPGLPVRS